MRQSTTNENQPPLLTGTLGNNYWYSYSNIASFPTLIGHVSSRLTYP